MPKKTPEPEQDTKELAKVVDKRMKPPACTEEPVEVLLSNADSAMEELMALSEDTKLSEDARLRVKLLINKANPVKLGTEEIENPEWKVPRLMIAQPTTQSASKPDSAKNGDIYTTSGTAVPRPFRFYLLYINEVNIKFTAGEKVPECRSVDARLGNPYGWCFKCPFLPINKQRGKWENRTKSDCVNGIEALVINDTFSEIYLINFNKTSRSAGAALQSFALQSINIYDQLFTLETEKKTADLGIYWIFKIAPEGTKLNPERTKDPLVAMSDMEKIAHSVATLYQAKRHVLLHDFYLQALDGENRAAELEKGMDMHTLNEALGLNDTEEEFVDDKRSSSNPM